MPREQRPGSVLTLPGQTSEGSLWCRPRDALRSAPQGPSVLFGEGPTRRVPAEAGERTTGTGREGSAVTPRGAQSPECEWKGFLYIPPVCKGRAWL